MRRNAASLVLITLVAGAVPALHGQGRDRGLVEMPSRELRGGLYFTGALGAGREQCKFETAPCGVYDGNGNIRPPNGNTWRVPVTSPSFALRLGGTVSPSVRLGGELFRWSADNGPTTESTVGLLANVQLYPSRRAGFYLKGGVGYGWSTVDFRDGSKATENGFMFNAGAGYDFALTPHVALGPVVDFYQGSYPGSIGAETLTERILFFGVSLTLQSGGRR